MELIINQCQNCGANLSAEVDGVKLCNYCGSSYGKKIAVYSKPKTSGLDYTVPNVSVLKTLPPSRLKVFKANLPKGLLVWISWGVVRGIMPLVLGKAYEIDANYNDVLFFSHVGSPLYFLGAAIMLCSVSVYQSTVGYKKIKARYK